MSSPAPTTVDQVMGWLRGVLGVWLPRLPFPATMSRLVALFRLPVSGPLPDPADPLPWCITVIDDWPTPLPGMNVALKDLRIEVREAAPASPASPCLDDPAPLLPVTPGAPPSASAGSGNPSSIPKGVSP